MESEELTKLVDDIYKNILDKFNPSARQLINAGKAYLKALHNAAGASKIYVDALSRVARHAQLGTWGGSQDVGSSLMRIVEIHKEIHEQEINILKAFYVDLLVPLETNLEKDTKVIQSEQKKFIQNHKTRSDSYTKALATMKKQRKKSRGSGKSNIPMDKELKNMQILEEEKSKLESFCEHSLKNALTQERRRYGFVLERQCSLAKHYGSFYEMAANVLKPAIDEWRQVASTREFLPKSVEDMFASRLKEVSFWSGEDECNGSDLTLNSQLRKARSVDSSCSEIPPPQNKDFMPVNLYKCRSEANVSVHSPKIETESESSDTLSKSRSNVSYPNDNKSEMRYLDVGKFDNMQIVRATFAYLCSGNNQLSFKEGDFIALVGDRQKGWQFGQNLRTQCSGWFPLAYTEFNNEVPGKKNASLQVNSNADNLVSLPSEVMDFHRLGTPNGTEMSKSAQTQNENAFRKLHPNSSIHHSSNDSGISNEPPLQPDVDYSDDDSMRQKRQKATQTQKLKKSDNDQEKPLKPWKNSWREECRNEQNWKSKSQYRQEELDSDNYEDSNYSSESHAKRKQRKKYMAREAEAELEQSGNDIEGSEQGNYDDYHSKMFKYSNKKSSIDSSNSDSEDESLLTASEVHGKVEKITQKLEQTAQKYARDSSPASKYSSRDDYKHMKRGSDIDESMDNFVMKSQGSFMSEGEMFSAPRSLQRPRPPSCEAPRPNIQNMHMEQKKNFRNDSEYRAFNPNMNNDLLGMERDRGYESNFETKLERIKVIEKHNKRKVAQNHDSNNNKLNILTSRQNTLPNFSSTSPKKYFTLDNSSPKVVKRTKSFWRFRRESEVLEGMSLWQHRSLVDIPALIDKERKKNSKPQQNQMGREKVIPTQGLDDNDSDSTITNERMENQLPVREVEDTKNISMPTEKSNDIENNYGIEYDRKQHRPSQSIFVGNISRKAIIENERKRTLEAKKNLPTEDLRSERQKKKNNNQERSVIKEEDDDGLRIQRFTESEASDEESTYSCILNNNQLVPEKNLLPRTKLRREENKSNASVGPWSELWEQDKSCGYKKRKKKYYK